MRVVMSGQRREQVGLRAVVVHFHNAAIAQAAVMGSRRLNALAFAVSSK